MNDSKYCKWFCVQWEDDNKWLFQSRCGESRVVTRHQKFFKELYSDDKNLCPNCKKTMTVGALMD